MTNADIKLLVELFKTKALMQEKRAEEYEANPDPSSREINTSSHEIDGLVARCRVETFNEVARMIEKMGSEAK